MNSKRNRHRRVRRADTGSVRSKQSLPPGSFVYVGRAQSQQPRLTLTEFSDDFFQQSHPPLKQCQRPGENHIAPGTTHWLHVHGVHDAELIKHISHQFKIDPLTSEDILHTRQRPKAEEFPDYLFIVLHSINVDIDGHSNTPHDAHLSGHNHTGHALESGQVALCLGKNFVLSFEEGHTNFTRNVVRQLEATHKKLRGGGPTYLVYSLLDTIVDQYTVALEEVSDRIETMETELLARSTPGQVEPIYDIKRMVLELRRLMLPVQDLILRLRKPGSLFFPAEMAPVLQDLQDHITNVADNLRDVQEVSTELINLHMSRATFRLNEVMRTLTVVGSIFIPLTFLAGVFGMNFKYMPELDWTYGYPAALGLMATISASMLYYFKRQGWF